ncbi:LytR/AlgR family response regulator transcription factor [Sunxiuqinia sp. sy24]|uniref:LytR/AlgR family response regulator transcription factor n=1 Tax=Sunxiuqinia sp. sy24 TaxID=3461495 RepID=UPI00404559BD
MFKVLIVDDEKADRDLLKYILKEHPDIELIEEADSAESALFQFMNIRPDIVFLDLVMPGKNGLEFISLIRKEKMDTNIVIVSSHQDMAIDAIKNEVYDFLLKPVDLRKLNTVVTAIEERRVSMQQKDLHELVNQTKQTTKLKLSSTSSYSIVDPKDILYCEAEGSYTHIHLDNGDIELANSYLKRMEEFLESYHFFRIGRSFLINLDKLRSVNRHDSSCVLIAQKKEIKLYGSKKQIRELCKIDNNIE